LSEANHPPPFNWASSGTPSSLKKQSLCAKHATSHNLALGLHGLYPEIQGPIHIRAGNNVLMSGRHCIWKWCCISFDIFSLLELLWECCLIKYKGTISQGAEMIAYTSLWDSGMSVKECKNCQPVIDCEIFVSAVLGRDGGCGRCLPRCLGARLWSIRFRFILQFASAFSAHGQQKESVGKAKGPMRTPTYGNYDFQGTTRPNNAYLRVSCPCIMHYAILLSFSYVFYDSEPRSNALFKICIMRLCIIRISTVEDEATPSTTGRTK
jgi:hypothetical protein